ncbi:probable serine/threonine-protein kinase PIX13 [Tanacetum coccineum]|uniref:Probable serine/threonine-protein kinase PIX13 n=1 Tax=Tanacetum coccineum TaxID=301880 RepID=A0ABQ4XLN6_9ASTR
MDLRLNQDYPSKGASKTAELILSCLESDPKKRPSMEDVVLSLQDINAIKMKPTQSKSLVNNPRHSMSVGKVKKHDGNLANDAFRLQRSLQCMSEGCYPYRKLTGGGVHLWVALQMFLGMGDLQGVSSD